MKTFTFFLAFTVTGAEFSRYYVPGDETVETSVTVRAENLRRALREVRNTYNVQSVESVQIGGRTRVVNWQF